MSVRTVATIVAALTLAGACAGGSAAGPKGKAAEVVAAAPDRTVAAGRARVVVATPDATASGSIELDGSATKLVVEPESAAASNPLLRDPLAAVELIRGALNVEFYGGNEVRGVSTFRYEIDVDPRVPGVADFVAALRGPTFYADVWVDADGRLRRIQLPINLNQARPRGRSKEVNDVVTVDLFDFR